MNPSEPVTITWFSVNLKSGGTVVTPGDALLRRHGSVSMEWLQRFPEVVRLSPTRPDVIFLQEAKWFDKFGYELLLYVERLLRRARLGLYRGFLTRSVRSHHHQAVFIDSGLMEPIHHWAGADTDEPRGLYGYVEVVVGGDDRRPIWLKSVHLNPRDGDNRVADAKEIHFAIKAGQRAMIAGDFNSITSRRTAEQGEPQREFAQMPATQRFGAGIWPATGPDGDTDPETRALDFLLDTGWVDQHINDRNTTPIVAPGYDGGGELIVDRCLTRGGLATLPGSVWVDGSNKPYSDHRAFGGQVVVVDEEAAS